MGRDQGGDSIHHCWIFARYDWIGITEVSMKNLVIGLGVSGMAALRWLLDRGEQVVAVDRSEFDGPFDFDRVVVSPGVPPQHPLYARAVALGIPVVGEAELALSVCSQSCIGITGTNGKSTTVMQITHILNYCGKRAVAAGNIGKPIIEVVGGDEILVVELSSYQLETMHTAVFDAAAILNISPDHLERHGSMEAYSAAKWRIRDLVKKGGLFLEGLDNNLEYVRAITRHFGVSDDEYEMALACFVGLPHRVEKFKEVEGISFYNDSKGTNVAATIYAVNKIEAPIILLAGGVDKGSSYREWLEPFSGKVKEVILFGEAAGKIASDLAGFVKTRQVDGLEMATEVAWGLAVPGDAIVLSPGCSSFDQFKNFEERGTLFKQFVEEIT